MELFAKYAPGPGRRTLVVAGGVASNATIRERLERLSAEYDFRFEAPPGWLCTDNAAMIAWAGIERLSAGEKSGLDFEARARWPLDVSGEPRVGYGKKGRKV